LPRPIDSNEWSNEMSETMAKNTRTRLMVLAAIGALLFTLAAGMILARPAAAVGIASGSVPENVTNVDTGQIIKPGDRVVIVADPYARIWSGVWFTGWNGPVGWSNCSYERKFPLNSFGGCSRPYSLIGNLNGRYFYVGQYKEFIHQEGESKLYLSINDDVVGNGSGAFKVTVKVYRNGSLCEISGGYKQCANYTW
jgi:hypothetical protein